MKLLQMLRKRRLRKKYYNRDIHLVALHNLEWFSKREMAEIRNVWPMLDIKRCDLIYSMMYKKEYGFDPYFLNDFQYQEILKKTNPYNQVISLTHKAMIDIYFKELQLPKVYLKCIANVFFDDKMNALSFNEGIERLIGLNHFVIKPTVSTRCGKGVKPIRLDDHNDKKVYLTELLHSYGRDFVVQEILHQQPEMVKLNPTSVNSCRITSIYLNRKFNCSTVLKVGKLGSEVDNWHSSYLIGVNQDGSLRDYGFDCNLNKVTRTDNGFAFGGMHIPHYDDMIQFVKRYHPIYFPNCGIVGWDICVDENGGVRVIEVNLDFPGILGEQLCSGTFFKDFRDDICTLMRTK